MKQMWLSVLLAIILTGCIKNDIKRNCNEVTVSAPDTESAAVNAYLQANNITATKDLRGFYYRIEKAGSATLPTVCSKVTVNYSGSLTNGTVFDSQNGISFGLADVILGWQEGVPLIGAGGTIYLYIPPSLGYGPEPNGAIPANSILVFKIDLLAVN